MSSAARRRHVALATLLGIGGGILCGLICFYLPVLLLGQFAYAFYLFAFFAIPAAVLGGGIGIGLFAYRLLAQRAA